MCALETDPVGPVPSTSSVMPGAYVDPFAVIGDHVHIGPNAVVLGQGGGTRTRIGPGVEIGANATVYGGVTIGAKARILPGSVIQRSIPPNAIVEGNPARIMGYTGTPGGPPLSAAATAASMRPGATQSRVKGVTLHVLPFIADIRGDLSVGEFAHDIPFKPLRYFLIFDVPSSETRGEHAHRKCEQFLIAVRGSVSVVADDGNQREEFTLNAPNVGVYLPAMTWGIQYRYSPDAVLLAFASDYYDRDDYIRDYDIFLEMVAARS